MYPKDGTTSSRVFVNHGAQRSGNIVGFFFVCHGKPGNSELATNLYNEYKIIRNNVTRLKRDSKLQYYKKFFDLNKKYNVECLEWYKINC